MELARVLNSVVVGWVGWVGETVLDRDVCGCTWTWIVMHGLEYLWAELDSYARA